MLDSNAVPNHVAYRTVIRNIAELVADHPDTDRLPVPSCPEWTVRDLVGHLVGICAFAIRRMQLGGGPDRTDEDGQGRQGQSTWADVGRSSEGMGVVGLVDEWARIGEQLERQLEARAGRRGSIMVMDAFTHELDLRYALGAPLPADHPAFSRAFEVLLNGFSAEVAAHNLPAVLVAVDGREWQAGIGEPVATLSGDRYDIYRSLAGRRTEEQIARLGWSRDSHRWLPAFTWGPFSLPTQPVENLVGVL